MAAASGVVSVSGAKDGTNMNVQAGITIPLGTLSSIGLSNPAQVFEIAM